MLVSVDDFQLNNVSAAIEDLINSFQTCDSVCDVSACVPIFVPHCQGHLFCPNRIVLSIGSFIPTTCGLILFVPTSLRCCCCCYCCCCCCCCSRKDNSTCPDLITFASYDWEFTDLRSFFLIFHLIMFLWVSEINFVLSNVITAGAVSEWYWTRCSGPKNKPDPELATKGGDDDSLLAPVWDAIIRAWRFHLGTAALGAAVLPLCYPPWVFLHYLEHQMHQIEQRTECARGLRKCLKSLMCCFTKCLKMFHRDAYALVAMQGHGFFDSCYHAADILDTPFEQIPGFKHATQVLFGVCKWTIAALCGLAVYISLYLELNVTLGLPSATSNVVPAFVAGLIGYMVARCFFDVYSTAVGTMLVCFCEDALVHNIERNDPNENHEEVFMPSSLVYTAFTVTERRNYGFYTQEDVLMIKQDIELLKSLRNTDGAQDAAAQVCQRHNYQIKAPVTVSKLINTLKQEAHEALAGASHQSYTSEQIHNIGTQILSGACDMLALHGVRV